MNLRELMEKEIPDFELPVESGKIKEFAQAIGDDNPIYYDTAYARSSGFGGILAPPTFTTTKLFWQKEGSTADIPGLDYRYVVHGEEEFEYLKHVLAGDVLTCKSRIAQAYEKEGKRGGKMIFVLFEYAFYNQRQEKVVVARSTMIQTGSSIKE